MVQSISPRPQMNNFSRATVPLSDDLAKKCPMSNDQLIKRTYLIELLFYSADDTITDNDNTFYRYFHANYNIF